MTISPFWKLRWNLRRRILRTTACGPCVVVSGCGSLGFGRRFGRLRCEGALDRIFIDHLARLLGGDNLFCFSGALAAKFIFIPVGGTIVVDHHFGFKRDGAFVGLGVDHGEGNLGHAQRLAVPGAGEDHVLHVGAAERFCALLAEHPAHPVEDVRLAAPVWAHHHGDARARYRQLGAVTEAFEAEDVDFFQFQHVSSRGDSGPFAVLGQTKFCRMTTDCTESQRHGQRTKGQFLWIRSPELSFLQNTWFYPGFFGVS